MTTVMTQTKEELFLSEGFVFPKWFDRKSGARFGLYRPSDLDANNYQSFLKGLFTQSEARPLGSYPESQGISLGYFLRYGFSGTLENLKKMCGILSPLPTQTISSELQTFLEGKVGILDINYLKHAHEFNLPDLINICFRDLRPEAKHELSTFRPSIPLLTHYKSFETKLLLRYGVGFLWKGGWSLLQILVAQEPEL